MGWNLRMWPLAALKGFFTVHNQKIYMYMYTHFAGTKKKTVAVIIHKVTNKAVFHCKLTYNLSLNIHCRTTYEMNEKGYKAGVSKDVLCYINNLTIKWQFQLLLLLKLPSHEIMVVCL